MAVLEDEAEYFILTGGISPHAQPLKTDFDRQADLSSSKTSR